MKLEFLTVCSKFPSWLAEIDADYNKKISFWFPVATKVLKSPTHERDAKDIKLSSESKLLMKELTDRDYVVLCDEKGQTFSSIAFSKRIENILGSGKKRLVFIVGGAYGVNDELKSRADLRLCLSNLTMNHYLALALIQEQVYRALTIIKRTSYHNA